MSRKSTVFLLLLALTALGLRIRGNVTRIMPSVPLDLLPKHIGNWRGVDVAMPPEVLGVLGEGHFLNRIYLRDNAQLIDLLIAYYPTQRNGLAIHSPQNCLPGAGWVFERSSRLTISDAAGGLHQVGDYLLNNGTVRFEVLYWYRSQGVDVASDYAAKGLLMVQAVRDRRTDGALIRMSTQVVAGEPETAAQQRLVQFAASLDPLLNPFIPK